MTKIYKTWAVRYTKIYVSEVLVEASGREEAKELAEKAELACDISQETKITANAASYYKQRVFSTPYTPKDKQ